MLLQATLHGIPKAEAKRRGDALIDRVGLSNAADRRVGTYSGGMRRRLDLGTALVHEPSVLFLDEPTTGLDPASRAAIWEEVRKLNDEGTTVFLTTQYLEEADQLANRVGIIDNGLMAAEGTPAQLKAQVGKPRLELTLAEGSREACQDVLAQFGDPLPPKDGKVVVALEQGAAGIAPIIRALDEADIAVQDLHLMEPSLDDVFLEKTGRHLEGAEDGAPEAEPEPAAEPA
jgi:ABC-2 type transport system ATP-binding protein